VPYHTPWERSGRERSLGSAYRKSRVIRDYIQTVTHQIVEPPMRFDPDSKRSQSLSIRATAQDPLTQGKVTRSPQKKQKEHDYVEIGINR
jgi:hypothetical protein